MGIKYSVEFNVVKFTKYKQGAPKHLLEKVGRWQKAGEFGGFENISYVPQILTENKSMYEVAPEMYEILEQCKNDALLYDRPIAAEKIDKLLVKARGGK
jgi:hypothetical protein